MKKCQKNRFFHFGSDYRNSYACIGMSHVFSALCVFHHLGKIGFKRRCTIATTNSFIDSLRLPTYTEADCTYMMHGVSDVYSSTCTEDDGKMGEYTLMGGGGLVKTGDKR